MATYFGGENGYCSGGSSCSKDAIPPINRFPSNSISGIALDGQDNVYIAGTTDSAGFPVTTVPGVTPFLANGYEADGGLVAKLNPTGTAILYDRLVGGTVNTIAVDAEDDAWIGGATTGVNFAATPGALQAKLVGGTQNGFLMKLDPTAQTLYATYIGTSGATRSPIFLSMRTAAYSLRNLRWSSLSQHDRFRRGGEFLAQIDPSGSSVLQSVMAPDGFGAQSLALGGIGDVAVAGSSGLVSRLHLSDLTDRSIVAVSNAAAGIPTLRVAPGEWIAVYGQGLGPNPAGTSDLQVLFGGVSAPSAIGAARPGECGRSFRNYRPADHSSGDRMERSDYLRGR